MDCRYIFLDLIMIFLNGLLNGEMDDNEIEVFIDNKISSEPHNTTLIEKERRV